MRRALRAEEMLRGIIMNGGRSCGPSARRQTGARGHDRHIAGHHAGSTQLRASGGDGRRAACSKLTRSDG